ncbi:MAG: Rrf2 family transcriptional regulator [Planctomycetota bacterium]
MFQLTKRTEYALIALVHLADQDAVGPDPARFVSAREIGDVYPLPRRLLAEVLKDLQRAGIVNSQRGASGGYAIVKHAHEVRLGDVVQALEGTPGLTGCESFSGNQGVRCEVEPTCPIKSPMSRVRHAVWTLFQRTTLHDLATPGALDALVGSAATELGEGAEERPEHSRASAPRQASRR